MVRLHILEIPAPFLISSFSTITVAFEVDAAFTVCVVNDREINRINEKENNIVLLNILVI